MPKDAFSERGLAAFMDKWSKKQGGTPKTKKTEIMDEIRATTIIQNYFRMYKSRVFFKKHKKRSNPVKELFETEKTYVKILDAMVNIFLRPLTTAGIIDTLQIRAIFSNVETIWLLNSTLLDDITERLNNWHMDQKIGDIFLQIVDFLKVYIDYVKDYEKALSTIEILEKENPTFSKFLKDQMRTFVGHEYEALPSLLITPVQRIPRYNLLLKEVLKATWKDHPDYDDLSAALSKVQETARYVNERAKEAEEMAKIYAIQNQISGNKFERNLLVPDRRVILEGEIGEIYGKKGKIRDVYCVLFNDMIITCKLDTKSLKKNKTQKMEFANKVPFDEALLIEYQNDENKNVKNAISVKTRKAEMILSFDSPTRKKQWYEVIYQLITETNVKSTFWESKKEIVAQQKAEETKLLIGQQYTQFRVRGMEASDSVQDEPSPGMRKFAQKKHSLSLSPAQKLDRAAMAKEEINEMLKEESQKKEEKDRETQEKANNFKNSIHRKYFKTESGNLANTEASEDSEASNQRSWVSMKRKSSTSAPISVPLEPTSSTTETSPRKSPRKEKEKEKEKSKRSSFGSLTRPKKEKRASTLHKNDFDDDEKHKAAVEKAQAAMESISKQYNKPNTGAEDSPPQDPNQPKLRNWTLKRNQGITNSSTSSATDVAAS